MADRFTNDFCFETHQGIPFEFVVIATGSI
jgi:hypothetical protein